jgi:transcriptional regulator with XRE-family HTH domain
MKERLLEFLRTENKSSAQLAEEIGVQPSGISHILSGRNNPSLDFVLKMLEKYQFISSDWLLFGKGNMYKEIKMQSLFDDTVPLDGKIAQETAYKEPEVRHINEKKNENEQSLIKEHSSGQQGKSPISHIVIFYSDGSFEEYTSR